MKKKLLVGLSSLVLSLTVASSVFAASYWETETNQQNNNTWSQRDANGFVLGIGDVAQGYIWDIDDEDYVAFYPKTSGTRTIRLNVPSNMDLKFEIWDAARNKVLDESISNKNGVGGAESVTMYFSAQKYYILIDRVSKSGAEGNTTNGYALSIQ
ncbi:hypothetical protein [Brevibacillus brevis]|uniref:hypothetical protein n=1 Tax=Brevibacillus brevis TaxID=1393 RepID=UPI001159BCB6|nr:hypothetical protein [Lysinibacillus sp. SDF0063]TQR32525.1 hypothetical protein C7Y45_20780 [Lysinibacillus sp. SDF0063]